jgi:glycosyltransferase involved in cell wall biosynthesis
MLTAEHFSPLIRRAAVLAGNLSASTIIANSVATRDSFLEAGGRADKTVVIYNGFSPEPFDRVQPSETDSLRAGLGLTGKFVVGAFGRLTPWKGQHVLIDALAALPSAHALIIGDALFGEHAYADELRTRAETQGVADRVHFVGFRRDIAALMKLCDVIVHTSTAPEPFGRVIVEAMLAGRPVIATRAGGAIEIVVDGESGLLVPPGSAPELSAALRSLAEDPPRAERLAAAGRERALQHFSMQATVSAIHQVLSASVRPNS